MERDGYLEEENLIGYDFFGYEIYENDDIYVLDDDKFLDLELPQEVIEILVHLGAKKVCATNTDQ